MLKKKPEQKVLLWKKYGIIALYFFNGLKSLTAQRKFIYDNDFASGTIYTPNSQTESKTATGQRQAQADQANQAHALPGKQAPGFGASGLGLFSPQVSQEKAMQEAADYLNYEKTGTNKFEPKQTVENMMMKMATNYMANTIASEMTPLVKSAASFTKLNVEVMSLVLAGGGAKLGYEAMSVGGRVLAGKALLGGAQGVFGSLATGSDLVGSAWGGLLGAALGTLNIKGIGAIKFSPTVESGISAGVSNLGGQGISIARNPNKVHFNPVSLGVSMWGGGMSGFITQDITIPLSKAVIESTIQEPINGIGAHIGRWQ